MKWLLYGANGYTGSLIARHAAVRGMRPILAGRNKERVEALATDLGFDARIFSLEDPVAAASQLDGVRVVLHCAGPFSRTSRSMVDACVAAGAHYLDITGEISVFEELANRNAEAQAAGIMLLPGVGFDVVPSDCLAGHLARRLPTAGRLTLAWRADGRPSRGTALTALESLPRGGMVRRGGRLTPVPAAWRTRTIDFGSGPARAVSIPWGDVSTAYYSTGIPDIEVYLEMPAGARWAMFATRGLGPLLALPPVQRVFERRIAAQAPGPDEGERARGSTVIWGRTEDGRGRKATARLRTPEGYTLTVRTALAAVERALSGEAPPGFQTPSLAYGPEFVLGIDGVAREDLD